MIKEAVLDRTGTYRYLLGRQWRSSTKGPVLFIMLNPSTADADVDDPTIRRCISYGVSWGYGGIEVVNLFALRSTDPKRLTQVPDPIGPENERYILEAAARASKIVAAWGVHGEINDRGLDVLHLLKDYNVYCLGVTKRQRPKHPLYLRKDLSLVMFQPKGIA